MFKPKIYIISTLLPSHAKQSSTTNCEKRGWLSVANSGPPNALASTPKSTSKDSSKTWLRFYCTTKYINSYRSDNPSNFKNVLFKILITFCAWTSGISRRSWRSKINIVIRRPKFFSWESSTLLSWTRAITFVIVTEERKGTTMVYSRFVQTPSIILCFITMKYSTVDRCRNRFIVHTRSSEFKFDHFSEISMNKFKHFENATLSYFELFYRDWYF